MISLKNRKVAHVRFHAGVSIGLKVLNSAVPGKDSVVHVDLVENGGGVYVMSKTTTGVHEDVIPSGNILSIRLEKQPEESLGEDGSKSKK